MKRGKASRAVCLRSYSISADLQTYRPHSAWLALSSNCFRSEHLWPAMASLKTCNAGHRYLRMPDLLAYTVYSSTLPILVAHQVSETRIPGRRTAGQRKIRFATRYCLSWMEFARTSGSGDVDDAGKGRQRQTFARRSLTPAGQHSHPAGRRLSNPDLIFPLVFLVPILDSSCQGHFESVMDALSA